MTTLALFALLFLFMFLGMPIAMALGLSSVMTILFFLQRFHRIHRVEIVRIAV